MSVITVGGCDISYPTELGSVGWTTGFSGKRREV